MAMGAFETGHLDMVHDAQLDYYGKRLATCSSDRSVVRVTCKQLPFESVPALARTSSSILKCVDEVTSVVGDYKHVEVCTAYVAAAGCITATHSSTPMAPVPVTRTAAPCYALQDDQGV